MFRLKLNSTSGVIERLRTSGPQIVQAVTVKMNLLMFKLQSKIVGEKIPTFFPNGAPNIAAEVRAIPATIQGTVIHGEVEAGGPATTKEIKGGPQAGQLVDYAAVQEIGVAHPWKIQPVAMSSAWAISQKVRVHSVSGLPQALSFLLNGKQIIVRSVTHPGLRERPFMRSGLADMEAQIIAELSETLSGFFVGDLQESVR